MTTALPIPKILDKVVQAAFLLACGGPLLSAGVVKAATESFTGFNTAFATPATEGGATIQGLSGPTVGTGQIGFGNLSIDAPPFEVWEVNINFSPLLSGSTSRGLYAYSLTASSGKAWNSFRLSLESLDGGFTARFAICSDSDFVADCQGYTLKPGGVPPIISLSIPLSAVYVKTSYAGVEFDSVRRISAEFFAEAAPIPAAPGPLPILGVGTAFGFSRKLRKRIKASR